MPENPPTQIDRNLWLTQPPEEILRQCRIDTFRGTGNGGQKRNKTDSAVRLTHTPSGCTATSDASRSQHENKSMALRQLRITIALTIRNNFSCYPAHLQWAPALTNDNNYSLWLAIIFDLLAFHQWQPVPAAKALNKSTSALLKAIARDRGAWQVLAKYRQDHNLPPLRHP